MSTPPLPQLAVRGQMRQEIADALRGALVAGRLLPGVVYSAPTLAAQFGVSVTPVREALLECCAENPERLIVDLGAVKFIDSTALGVLIEARTRLANRKSFLLAAPGLETRRALEISGLDRHFAVHESVEQARTADF